MGDESDLKDFYGFECPYCDKDEEGDSPKTLRKKKYMRTMLMSADQYTKTLDDGKQHFANSLIKNWQNKPLWHCTIYHPNQRTCPVTKDSCQKFQFTEKEYKSIKQLQRSRRQETKNKLKKDKKAVKRKKPESAKTLLRTLHPNPSTPRPASGTLPKTEVIKSPKIDYINKQQTCLLESLPPNVDFRPPGTDFRIGVVPPLDDP